LTRRTLLITSRPRSSKTSTFHIGSPSEFKIGVAFETRPFAELASCCVEEVSGAGWLRLSIFSIEAAYHVVSVVKLPLPAKHTWKAYLLGDLVATAVEKPSWITQKSASITWSTCKASRASRLWPNFFGRSWTFYKDSIIFAAF
jgi:hypothetical protein